MSGVRPRARIMIGQLPTDLRTADTEHVKVKKYVENGILIIERNGVKYDALGGPLN
jgi:hypothetical protein